MRDWCILDVPGVLDWARRTYPERPIHWVGHSMGGFATGLAHNNHLIARQLNVATLSGYWGRMASPERYRVRLLMGYCGAADRACAAAIFPGWLMGGEDMPGPAFLEWAGWCMTPEFLFADRTLAERSNFAQLPRARPLRPDRGRRLGHAGRRRRTWPSISPAAWSDSTWRDHAWPMPAPPIGHHGFFREQFRDTLWPKALAWLDGQPFSQVGCNSEAYCTVFWTNPQRCNTAIAYCTLRYSYARRAIPVRGALRPSSESQVRNCGPRLRISGAPICIMVRPISSLKMSSARTAPVVPPAAAP